MFVIVPNEFVEFSSQWHCGQVDVLYAIASTGKIATVGLRPRNEDGEPMNDREWMLDLISDAEASVNLCILNARKKKDLKNLKDFKLWLEHQYDAIDKLNF